MATTAVMRSSRRCSCFFPEEKPAFSEDRGETGECWAESRMSAGKYWLTVKTELFYNGKSACAAVRERIAGDIDRFEWERRARFAVKRSFYLAAVKITGKTPPWGALTGIRPAKIATKLLTEGKSPKDALRELEGRYFVTPPARAAVPGRGRVRDQGRQGAFPGRHISVSGHTLLPGPVPVLLVCEPFGHAGEKAHSRISGRA